MVAFFLHTLHQSVAGRTDSSLHSGVPAVPRETTVEAAGCLNLSVFNCRRTFWPALPSVYFLWVLKWRAETESNTQSESKRRKTHKVWVCKGYKYLSFSFKLWAPLYKTVKRVFRYLHPSRSYTADNAEKTMGWKWVYSSASLQLPLPSQEDARSEHTLQLHFHFIQTTAKKIINMKSFQKYTDILWFVFFSDDFHHWEIYILFHLTVILFSSFTHAHVIIITIIPGDQVREEQLINQKKNKKHKNWKNQKSPPDWKHMNIFICV